MALTEEDVVMDMDMNMDMNVNADRVIKPFGIEMNLEISLYWEIFHEYVRSAEDESFSEFAYDWLVDKASFDAEFLD